MEEKILIEASWNNRDLLKEVVYSNAIKDIIDKLDKGIYRVAEPIGATWQVNEWIKKAVLLYFRISKYADNRSGTI